MLLPCRSCFYAVVEINVVFDRFTLVCMHADLLPEVVGCVVVLLGIAELFYAK